MHPYIFKYVARGGRFDFPAPSSVRERPNDGMTELRPSFRVAQPVRLRPGYRIWGGKMILDFGVARFSVFARRHEHVAGRLQLA